MPDQPNGVAHTVKEHVNGTTDSSQNGPELENGVAAPETNGETVASASSEEIQNGVHDTGPRGTKRKLSTPKSSGNSDIKKFPSPPWAKFEPKNPTSFSENGIRKSGRTNALPLELQPQGATRKKRAAYLQQHGVKKESKSPATPRRRDGVADKSPQAAPGRTVPSPSTTLQKRPSPKAKTTTPAPAPAKSPAHARQRSSSTVKAREVPARGRRKVEAGGARTRPQDEVPHKDAPNGSHDNTQQDTKPFKPLKLTFRRPPPSAPPLLHPGNLRPAKKFGSLRESFEQPGLTAEEGTEKRLTDEEVHREARALQLLEKAARPGGPLSGEGWPPREVPLQEEPPNPLTVSYYITEHVKQFAKELDLEHGRHRRDAKIIAYAAQEHWLRRQPKTAEQISLEQWHKFRLLYRVVCKQLSDKWELVTSHAKRMKIAQYEQEQQRKMEQELTNLVDQSQLTSKQRREAKNALDSGAVLEDGDSAAEAYGILTSDSEDVETDEGGSDSDDDMTSSGSEDDNGSNDNNIDDNEELFGDELRKRIYGDDADDSASAAPLDVPEDVEQVDVPPDIPANEEPDGPDTDAVMAHDGVDETAISETDYAAVELEDVDDALLDEDESGDSDSGTEESSEASSDDDGDVSSSGEEEGGGLMGFFAPSVRQKLQAPAEDPTVKDEADIVMPEVEPTEDDAAKSEQTSTTALPSGQDTPATTVESKPSVEPTNEVEVEHAGSEHSISERFDTPSTYRTPVPSLLRGTLREYQHQGLDWLAGMYDSDTNGILADEMGLGKTIQTISLLAHLAVEKKIWGPHLIVVPTSVILNWEMEFKKFLPGFKILTYYGNQEERREKRKGWMDDDKWHVCITSYQLALQDQQSLKRRNWHYIVLDEAHNIKNFRSQRWQTLLTFKSHARLLLTGTPLQNNLTELWSLLFFLAPEADEHGETRFKDLKAFSNIFKRPVEQILDNGREALDDQAKEIVTKLHHVLRPHLLRRLKADVEKQMPKKYEHVVRCRLSKRQRQLYDGYMGLAGTRESFASGNYMSIINCLMQLRKVCNHPDLFETRQIVTSYAMPRSATADYEIKELLLRRTILKEKDVLPSKSTLMSLWDENKPSLHVQRARQLGALISIATACEASADRAVHMKSGSTTTLDTALATLDEALQQDRTDELLTAHRNTANGLRTEPAYPIGLLERFTFEKPTHFPKAKPKRRARLTEWELTTSTVLKEAFSLNPALSDLTEVAVRKFGCITPAVVAPGLARQALTPTGIEAVESIEPMHAQNPFHESQTRLSIAFPDRSLIQYDCGKLQQLARLLRDLQAGGHRALIFTQMTRVLDILEQFLNLHGHRYLRLDGSTKIESRQALTDQFNTDTRILAFILSSRSGGLGINLTGADTVIFYDLDWNPAMDKQCQDRCHRIGQTRDVHIYRFVSEGTIEANILRKSNQKRMLDDVVIQEGEFTTDAFYRTDDADEADAEASAALDKVLGGGVDRKREQQVLEQAEDKEDVDAARQAQKEVVQTDDVEDFAEKSTPLASAARTPDAKFGSPRPPAVNVDATPITGSQVADEAQQTQEETEAEEPGHYEDYMLRWKLKELEGASFVNVSERQRKKAKKGKEHGIRIRI